MKRPHLDIVLVVVAVLILYLAIGLCTTLTARGAATTAATWQTDAIETLREPLSWADFEIWVAKNADAPTSHQFFARNSRIHMVEKAYSSGTLLLEPITIRLYANMFRRPDSDLWEQEYIHTIIQHLPVYGARDRHKSYRTLFRSTAPLLPLLWCFYPAYRWILARRRTARGLCSTCGYPRGSSDHCPECGATHAPARAT